MRSGREARNAGPAEWAGVLKKNVTNLKNVTEAQRLQRKFFEYLVKPTRIAEGFSKDIPAQKYFYDKLLLAVQIHKSDPGNGGWVVTSTSMPYMELGDDLYGILKQNNFVGSPAFENFVREIVGINPKTQSAKADGTSKDPPSRQGADNSSTVALFRGVVTENFRDAIKQASASFYGGKFSSEKAPVSFWQRAAFKIKAEAKQFLSFVYYSVATGLGVTYLGRMIGPIEGGLVGFGAAFLLKVAGYVIRKSLRPVGQFVEKKIDQLEVSPFKKAEYLSVMNIDPVREASAKQDYRTMAASITEDLKKMSEKEGDREVRVLTKQLDTVFAWALEIFEHRLWNPQDPQSIFKFTQLVGSARMQVDRGASAKAVLISLIASMDEAQKPGSGAYQRYQKMIEKGIQNLRKNGQGPDGQEAAKRLEMLLDIVQRYGSGAAKRSWVQTEKLPAALKDSENPIQAVLRTLQNEGRAKYMASFLKDLRILLDQTDDPSLVVAIMAGLSATDLFNLREIAVADKVKETSQPYTQRVAQFAVMWLRFFEGLPSTGIYSNPVVQRYLEGEKQWLNDQRAIFPPALDTTVRSEMRLGTPEDSNLRRALQDISNANPLYSGEAGAVIDIKALLPRLAQEEKQLLARNLLQIRSSHLKPERMAEAVQESVKRWGEFTKDNTNLICVNSQGDVIGEMKVRRLFHDTVNLSDFGILQTEQKKGIGTLMMNVLFLELQKQGKKFLTIPAETQSTSFYLKYLEKLGIPEDSFEGNGITMRLAHDQRDWDTNFTIPVKLIAEIFNSAPDTTLRSEARLAAALSEDEFVSTVASHLKDFRDHKENGEAVARRILEELKGAEVSPEFYSLFLEPYMSNWYRSFIRFYEGGNITAEQFRHHGLDSVEEVFTALVKNGLLVSNTRGSFALREDIADSKKSGSQAIMKAVKSAFPDLRKDQATTISRILYQARGIKNNERVKDLKPLEVRREFLSFLGKATVYRGVAVSNEQVGQFLQRVQEMGLQSNFRTMRIDQENVRNLETELFRKYGLRELVTRTISRKRLAGLETGVGGEKASFISVSTVDENDPDRQHAERMAEARAREFAATFNRFAILPRQGQAPHETYKAYTIVVLKAEVDRYYLIQQAGNVPNTEADPKAASDYRGFLVQTAEGEVKYSDMGNDTTVENLIAEIPAGSFVGATTYNLNEGMGHFLDIENDTRLLGIPTNEILIEFQWTDIAREFSLKGDPRAAQKVLEFMKNEMGGQIEPQTDNYAEKIIIKHIAREKRMADDPQRSWKEAVYRLLEKLTRSDEKQMGAGKVHGIDWERKEMLPGFDKLSPQKVSIERPRPLPDDYHASRFAQFQEIVPSRERPSLAQIAWGVFHELPDFDYALPEPEKFREHVEGLAERKYAWLNATDLKQIAQMIVIKPVGHDGNWVPEFTGTREFLDRLGIKPGVLVKMWNAGEANYAIFKCEKIEWETYSPIKWRWIEGGKVYVPDFDPQRVIEALNGGDMVILPPLRSEARVKSGETDIDGLTEAMQKIPGLDKGIVELSPTPGKRITQDQLRRAFESGKIVRLNLSGLKDLFWQVARGEKEILVDGIKATAGTVLFSPFETYFTERYNEKIGFAVYEMLNNAVAHAHDDDLDQKIFIHLNDFGQTDPIDIRVIDTASFSRTGRENTLSPVAGEQRGTGFIESAGEAYERRPLSNESSGVLGTIAKLTLRTSLSQAPELRLGVSFKYHGKIIMENLKNGEIATIRDILKMRGKKKVLYFLVKGREDYLYPFPEDVLKNLKPGDIELIGRGVRSEAREYEDGQPIVGPEFGLEKWNVNKVIETFLALKAGTYDLDTMVTVINDALKSERNQKVSRELLERLAAVLNARIQSVKFTVKGLTLVVTRPGKAGLPKFSTLAVLKEKYAGRPVIFLAGPSTVTQDYRPLVPAIRDLLSEIKKQNSNTVITVGTTAVGYGWQVYQIAKEMGFTVVSAIPKAHKDWMSDADDFLQAGDEWGDADYLKAISDFSDAIFAIEGKIGTRKEHKSFSDLGKKAFRLRSDLPMSGKNLRNHVVLALNPNADVREVKTAAAWGAVDREEALRDIRKKYEDIRAFLHANDPKADLSEDQKYQMREEILTEYGLIRDNGSLDFDAFVGAYVQKASNKTKQDWLRSYEVITTFIEHVQSRISETEVESFSKSIHNNGYWRNIQAAMETVKVTDVTHLQLGLAPDPESGIEAFLTAEGLKKYRARFSSPKSYQIMLSDINPDKRLEFFAKFAPQKDQASIAVLLSTKIPLSKVQIFNGNVANWSDLEEDARRRYPDPNARLKRMLGSQLPAIASAFALTKSTQRLTFAAMDYLTAVNWRYTGHWNGKYAYDGLDEQGNAHLKWAAFLEREKSAEFKALSEEQQQKERDDAAEYSPAGLTRYQVSADYDSSDFNQDRYKDGPIWQAVLDREMELQGVANPNERFLRVVLARTTNQSKFAFISSFDAVSRVVREAQQKLKADMAAKPKLCAALARVSHNRGYWPLIKTLIADPAKVALGRAPEFSQDEKAAEKEFLSYLTEDGKAIYRGRFTNPNGYKIQVKHIGDLTGLYTFMSNRLVIDKSGVLANVEAISRNGNDQIFNANYGEWKELESDIDSFNKETGKPGARLATMNAKQEANILMTRILNSTDTFLTSMQMSHSMQILWRYVVGNYQGEYALDGKDRNGNYHPDDAKLPTEAEREAAAKKRIVSQVGINYYDESFTTERDKDYEMWISVLRALSEAEGATKGQAFVNTVLRRAGNESRLSWWSIYNAVKAFLSSIVISAEDLKKYAPNVHNKGYWAKEKAKINNAEHFLLGSHLDVEGIDGFLNPEALKWWNNRYKPNAIADFAELAKTKPGKKQLADIGVIRIGLGGYQFNGNAFRDAQARETFYARKGKSAKAAADGSSQVVINENAMSFEKAIEEAAKYGTGKPEQDRASRIYSNQEVPLKCALVFSGMTLTMEEMAYFTAVIWRYAGHWSGEKGYESEWQVSEDFLMGLDRPEREKDVDALLAAFEVQGLKPANSAFVVDHAVTPENLDDVGLPLDASRAKTLELSLGDRLYLRVNGKWYSAAITDILGDELMDGRQNPLGDVSDVYIHANGKGYMAKLDYRVPGIFMPAGGVFIKHVMLDKENAKSVPNRNILKIREMQSFSVSAARSKARMGLDKFLLARAETRLTDKQVKDLAALIRGAYGVMEPTTFTRQMQRLDAYLKATVLTRAEARTPVDVFVSGLPAQVQDQLAKTAEKILQIDEMMLVRVFFELTTDLQAQAVDSRTDRQLGNILRAGFLSKRVGFENEGPASRLKAEFSELRQTTDPKAFKSAIRETVVALKTSLDRAIAARAETRADKVKAMLTKPAAVAAARLGRVDTAEADANLPVGLKASVGAALVVWGILDSGMKDESMAQALDVVAQVTAKKTANWIIGVRKALASIFSKPAAAETGKELFLTLECIKAGDTIREADLGVLVVNEKLAKGIIIMADGSDRIAWAAAGAEAKALEKMAFKKLKELGATNRFGVTVVNRNKPGAALEAKNKLAQRLAKRHGNYVLMGAATDLKAFPSDDISSRVIRIDQTYSAADQQRLAASILAARVSEKILGVQASEIEQVVKDMLNKSTGGVYTFNPDLWKQTLTIARQVVQAIQSAA